MGDAGNAADTTGRGAVGYEYGIGRYEISIDQYAAFLNAVAASDPNDLYSTEAMGLNTAGIARIGPDGLSSCRSMTTGKSFKPRPTTCP